MKTDPAHREGIKKTIKRLNSSFFYYDLDGLKSHLNVLSGIIGDDVKLWYACKANPLSAVLKVFRNCSFGIDVASKGELDQVLRSGVLPQHVLATGPSKSKKYLSELLEENVEIIVCESTNQLLWLEEVAKEKNLKPKVLLRVQLDWKEGESVLGGNAVTPFGEDVDGWKNFALKEITHLDIQGIHVFQWGNILSLEKLTQIWETIAEKSIELAKDLNINLNILDLGGGLGIPYSLEEKAIDPNQLVEELRKLKNKFHIPELWMELGRYAMGPFGHYVSQVIDRKTVRGKNLLVLEGGVNHIARPAITGQAFPVELFRESEAENISYRVHGPLCTALDFLGEFQLPDDIKPGDWLCFHQAGAYGFTEGMPYFLCHDQPGEVIFYDGNLMIPRTPKKAEDWLV